MTITNGIQFLEALSFQKKCRDEEDASKTKASKEGARERYQIWADAITLYMQRLKDNIKDV